MQRLRSAVSDISNLDWQFNGIDCQNLSFLLKWSRKKAEKYFTSAPSASEAVPLLPWPPCTLASLLMEWPLAAEEAFGGSLQRESWEIKFGVNWRESGAKGRDGRMILLSSGKSNLTWLLQKMAQGCRCTLVHAGERWHNCAWRERWWTQVLLAAALSF